MTSSHEQVAATVGTPRRGKELINATRPFATETRALSWWYLLSGVGLMLAFAVAAALTPWWPLRLVASVLEALLILRVFILYHDFLHRAILSRSRLARFIMHLYGYLVLAPPSVWKRTHDYHHANNAKMVGSQVGSYPVVSAAMWRRLPEKRRRAYRLARHPLTILMGYFTLFLFGMGVGPILSDARKNKDSAIALVLYAATAAALIVFGGVDVFFFALFLPHFIAAATGAYLFFAQHNFPGIKLHSRHDWNYTAAALESSSFLVCGPVMNWFSGNIGYHHVHHMNPSIPFYRLPEAMAAVEELQHPVTTTLWPRDVLACLRLKLWDGEADAMVESYPNDS